MTSRIVSTAKEGFRIFSRRGARFLGAAVAFYALLSAAPLFVLVLHLVGAVFGRGRAESALWGGLGSWFASDALEAVRDLTERVESREASGSIFGSLLVLYGSTRLFRALGRAVNHLWGIDLDAIDRARPKAYGYALRYGGALLLTVLVSLLVAVIIAEKSAVLFVASHGGHLPDPLVWMVDLGTSGALAFILFTALFWFLPETRVTLREATVAGVVSTALFAFGSSVVTVYLRHKRVSDLYAGASTLVVAVLWVYYSAQVFFLGACMGAAMRPRACTAAPRSDIVT